MAPDHLKYTEEHEWISVEGDIATVGITDFAQGELGEIVYIEIDTVGDTLEKGDVFGTVEAVKTTSDLFMPVSGEVMTFNPALSEDDGDEPGLVNEDPYEKGWIVKIKLSDPGQLDDLLDVAAYTEITG